MALHKRALLTVAAALVAAFALVACGGGSDSSSSSPTTTTSASASSSSASSGGGSTVDLADNSALGSQILVDSQGQTLYMFEKDTSGDASTCSGACAQEWPPLTAKGQVTAGSGLDASQVTTFKRDDGTTQVAFAGHPVYTYSGDSAPGDANGNGLDFFGGEWYAMDSSGASVEGSSTSSDSTSSDSTSGDSSSGSGYSSSY
jgi:predicted lipoprotein with Yx(FWY)xxD motif